MNKLTTLLLALLAGTIIGSATDYPAGLPGLFSINAHGGQVRFAQGNLQFLADSGETVHPDGTISTGTWQFAESQFLSIGGKNKTIAENDTNWIDLFGWGTSGYDNTVNDPCAIYFQPYSSSNELIDCDETNRTGYGPSIDQAYRGLVKSSKYYDWGIYNIISNSAEGVAWRTLSYEEWYYLLNGRPNAKNLRSQATIPNLHGYILLPDNWETPQGLTFVPLANDWETNTYNKSQWSDMEQSGAVFLPASGQRRGTNLYNGNTHGYYWTSSANNARQAQIIHFNDTILFTNSRYQRSYGNSIRLVTDVNMHIDPIAKFEGFDNRGTLMGDWIYNNGGFKNPANLQIQETDTVYHKYDLILVNGGQESTFTLGGVRFSYTNSGSNKVAFKTTNLEIHPNGKDRKIIIPTYPGDKILISVADTVDYNGLKAEGLESANVDLKAGDNILVAKGDSIVIISSNATGSEMKVKINAIMCIYHDPAYMGLESNTVSSKTNKFFRNGQIYIRRGEKIYTLQGQEVK